MEDIYWPKQIRTISKERIGVSCGGVSDERIRHSINEAIKEQPNN